MVVLESGQNLLRDSLKTYGYITPTGNIVKEIKRLHKNATFHNVNPQDKTAIIEI